MARTKIAEHQLADERYQANTTNSLKSKVFEQSGWGFTTGSGTASAEKGVTFPEAFSELMSIQVTIAGYKDGSDPTSPSDVQGAAGTWASFHSANTSGFQARTQGTATFTSNTRMLFHWTAKGTRA